MLMYNSSKGPVPIDSMVYSHAKAALAKLYRDEPHRTTEIGALEVHVQKLAANPPEAAPVAGHNQPPEEVAPAKGTMSWDAIKAHMDDLLTEAHNWADGEAIDNQAKADEIGKLRQQLQDAASLADEARVVEKKPHDDAAQKVQDRYNVYIAPLKNKKPGSISSAVAALGSLLTPWLNKLEADKKAREDAARKIAEDAQAVAIEARRSAIGTGDLGAMTEADSLLDAAEEASKLLRNVENEKVQAKGEHRAIGLRSKWIAKLRDGEGGKALTHYARTQPDRVRAFLQVLADEDVKAGTRPVDGESPIPGVDIIEERVV